MIDVTNKVSRTWIYSSWIESVFILSPPFISLLGIIFFQQYFLSDAKVSLGAWVILILLIDVAHVYSTLYQTYFHNETFNKRKTLLTLVPLLAWITGVILYEMDKMIFWRVLAYLAVFHFIRQQYGFMRLYARVDNQSITQKKIDAWAIYCATIYPILFWHLTSSRKFNWFMEGDFFYFQSPFLLNVITIIYIIVIAVYIVKEGFQTFKNRSLNIPKNLVIAGTYLSWFFGIIYFNGDLIFTTINVVSHGIPYMALVWITGKKNKDRGGQEITNLNFDLYSNLGLILFVLIISLFAYLEEGIWDAVVWREHQEIFQIFSFLPQIQNEDLLAFILPLLALPQISHYIIDGFIWKAPKKNYREKTA